MMSVSAILVLSMSVSMAIMEPESGDLKSALVPDAVSSPSDTPVGKWLESFEEAKAQSIEKKLPIVLQF